MVLEELESVVAARADADPETSYTARLLGDSELSRRKIMEEAFEVCLELGRRRTGHDEEVGLPFDSGRVAEEAADLVYHLMVGLVGAGVPFADVMKVLEGRRR